MRFNEFNKRSDEAILALGALKKGISAIKGAVADAGGVGAAVKQAGGIKGAMKAAGQVAGAAMGSKPAAGPQSNAQKQAQKAQQQLQKQIIKKGGSIPFPTKSGQAKEFKIDDATFRQFKLKAMLRENVHLTKEDVEMIRDKAESTVWNF